MKKIKEKLKEIIKELQDIIIEKNSHNNNFKKNNS